METISIILILLVAVVASGVLQRMIPFAIPLPLIQIALGAIIAAVFKVGVELNPEIFFLLFLPPLLFLDGWRIPKEGVFRDIGTILELALGLVIFTVVGMGFFIFWLVPDMPLPVAFALAAVLAPTDPIAVSAIAKVSIPKRLMHILEGEALLNDASGLVCLRLAIAGALTGAFSITEAVKTFAWLAIGGLAIGIAVSWCAGRAKRWISKRFGNDQGSFILISLLLPFAAYLLAEHFHCSGILAAVAAGITMTFVEKSTHAGAVSRIRRDVVWDMVQFVANGTIFILLGEQLPELLEGAMATARQIGHPEPWWLPLDVLVITCVLIAARFLWVWISLHFTIFRAKIKEEKTPQPHLRLVGATALAGVKGAITLAGILTLPLTLADGSAFPTRDLAIFLAAGVIILSLIIASVGLPFLLKDLDLPAEDTNVQEDAARVIIAEAAIEAIEEERHRLSVGHRDADTYAQASLRVMAYYRHQIDAVMVTLDDKESSARLRQVKQALFKVGLRAEREAIARLQESKDLTTEGASKFRRKADLAEARHLV